MIFFGTIIFIFQVWGFDTALFIKFEYITYSILVLITSTPKLIISVLATSQITYKMITIEQSVIYSSKIYEVI